MAACLEAPVYLTAPAGDARHFVLEQPGRIRVIRDGRLLPRPHLDLSAKVATAGGAAADRSVWRTREVGSVLSFGKDALGEFSLLAARGVVIRLVADSSPGDTQPVSSPEYPGRFRTGGRGRRCRRASHAGQRGAMRQA